jgi:hypothetical protein
MGNREFKSSDDISYQKPLLSYIRVHPTVRVKQPAWMERISDVPFLIVEEKKHIIIQLCNRGDDIITRNNQVNIRDQTDKLPLIWMNTLGTRQLLTLSDFVTEPTLVLTNCESINCPFTHEVRFNNIVPLSIGDGPLVPLKILYNSLYVFHDTFNVKAWLVTHNASMKTGHPYVGR